jgi:hypothetical protein
MGAIWVAIWEEEWISAQEAPQHLAVGQLLPASKELLLRKPLLLPKALSLLSKLPHR